MNWSLNPVGPSSHAIIRNDWVDFQSVSVLIALEGCQYGEVA